MWNTKCILGRASAATALAVLLSLGVAGSARADLIVTGTGTGTDGAALSATADFSVSGNTLTVVLTNNDVAISNASVLTELLFNGPTPSSPLPSSAGSAAVTAGSSLVANGGVTDTSGVGENWQYVAGTGLGTTGIDFGPDGNLCGTPGCGVPVDGAGWGIVGTGTDLTLDGMKAGETLIENSATFSITSSSPFDLAAITSVSFVYGTGADDETKITCTPGTPGCVFNPPVPVPEPSSLAILGFGLTVIGLALRRRSRKMASQPDAAA